MGHRNDYKNKELFVNNSMKALIVKVCKSLLRV